jgi:ATP-binding cassette subfamily F protein 3
MPKDWAVAAVEQETRLSARQALDYVIDGDTELRQTEARLAQAERDHDSTQIAGCHERLQEIDGYQKAGLHACWRVWGSPMRKCISR